jgi:hypothetical protein
MFPAWWRSLVQMAGVAGADDLPKALNRPGPSPGWRIKYLMVPPGLGQSLVAFAERSPAPATLACRVWDNGLARPGQFRGVSAWTATKGQPTTCSPKYHAEHGV